VLPHSYHNPLALQAIFSLLFLTFVLWCCQGILLMSCKIWIITKNLLKKFSYYQLLSMEMSYLNCHPCFRLHTCLRKCKAWIESMMTMFGARWSQLISIIVLGFISRKLLAWVTCGVYMTNGEALCTLALQWNLLVRWLHTYSNCWSNGTVSIHFLLCIQIL
jgi:hypothetical protein